MFTLRTGCDLGALPNQVVAVGKAWVILFAHVIEGPDVFWIVGQEYKVVAKFFLGILGDFSFTLRVHITIGSWNLVASGFDDLVSLGEWDSGEGNTWNFDIQVV